MIDNPSKILVENFRNVNPTASEDLGFLTLEYRSCVPDDVKGLILLQPTKG